MEMNRKLKKQFEGKKREKFRKDGKEGRKEVTK
jgi:hypothetical protein